MEFQSGGVGPIRSIKEGWELIKNDYWLFFGMTLVLSLIIIAVALVLNLIVGGVTAVISGAIGVAAQRGGDAGNAMQAIVPQLIGEVFGIFTGVIVTTLAAMLTCGIYTALSRKADGGMASFGDLFEGFNYFQQCFLVSVIVTLINFVINVVILLMGVALGVSAFRTGLISADGKLNPNIMGALFGFAAIIGLIYFVISLTIAALTLFVYPLIADRKVPAMQALGLSVRAGLSNLPGIIGLFILQILIIFAGMLACLIGVFFVAPILSASIFAAYRSVFGRNPNPFGGRHAPPAPPVFHNQPNF